MQTPKSAPPAATVTLASTPGAALANFDLETVLAIEPVLDCGVIARELELVLPLAREAL